MLLTLGPSAAAGAQDGQAHAVVAAAATASDAPTFAVQKIGSYTVYVSEVSPQPVSFNNKHTVLLQNSGAYVGGSIVYPSNDHPPAGDHELTQLYWQDLNDSDLAVGSDPYGTPPRRPVAWHVGASNPLVYLNLSGVGASAGAAKVVDDAGEIAGTATVGSGYVGFYMASMTSAAQPVPSPAGNSGGGQIVAMNNAYELVQDITSGDYYRLDRSSGKYHKLDLTLGGAEAGVRQLASDGTVLDAYYRSVTRTVHPDDTTTATPWGVGLADNGGVYAFDPGTYQNGVYQGGRDASYYTSAGQTVDLDAVTGMDIDFEHVSHGGEAIFTVAEGTVKEDQNATFDVYVITPSGNAAPVVNSVGDAPATAGGTQGCATGSSVTDNGKSQPECTLRAAIQAENAGSVSQKTITFALPTDGDSPGVISPKSLLPALTANGVTVDGSWNSGTVSLLGTALTGSQALLAASGGQDVVQDLALCKAPTAVLMNGTTGGGTVRAVSVCASKDSGKVANGVIVTAPKTMIGGTTSADRNIVDNATAHGIWVHGAPAHNTAVQGNWVGVAPDGTSLLLTGNVGIDVVDTSSVTVGGVASSTGAAPGNVSPGGIQIIGQGATASGTHVQGNLVGLLPDGSQPPSSPGLVWGLTVWGRTSNTLIGGSGGARNVFDNASSDQITLNGIYVDGTVIDNNLLGTDVTGATPTPDTTSDPKGISVDGAHATQIGAAGLGNVIAAQRDGGILVNKRPGTVTIDNSSTPLPGTGDKLIATSTAAVVRDNIIGPAADGTTVSGDQAPDYGVQLSGIGDTLGPDNTIAGNATGVSITFGGNAETVVGNRIGTDPTGTKAVSNGTGVRVASHSYGAAAEQIGAAGEQPNTIAGNLDDVALDGPATVVNNTIGTVANGLSALRAPAPSSLPSRVVDGAPGGVAGPLIDIANTAGGSVVGGTRAGFGNTIAGSPTDGVRDAAPATISGNDIGVGSDATTAVANSGAGVRATASGVVVGAPAPGGRGTATVAGGNVIANNTGGGVVVGSGAHGVLVLSNQIHDNTGAAITLADSTANQNIAPPSITGAAQDGQGHTVVLLTAPARSVVQVYAAANCTSGSGQGTAILATATVDETGNAAVALPVQAVGSELDATTTLPVGTSAFSPCTAVAVAADGANTAKTAKPHDTQNTSGSGFTPGETVDASVHSDPVQLAPRTADGNGDVTFRFAVPAGLQVGTHYVMLTGDTSGRSVAVPFNLYTAPSPPRALIARAGKHRVTLLWTAPSTDHGSTLTAYRIQRSTDNRTFRTLRTVDARSYADTAVVGGLRYFYRVQALNAAGASPGSSTANAVPYTVSSAPRTLHVTARHAALQVRWSAPAHANGAAVTSYVVQYAACTIGARHCTARSRSVHGRSVNLTNLSRKHRYHVRVIAVNRAGRSPATRQFAGRPRA